jgi:hypothetical protein
MDSRVNILRLLDGIHGLTGSVIFVILILLVLYYSCFLVLSALVMKLRVYWDILPCS